MVQEVQTSVAIPQENTLETIEAIGTSSFKIVEWRQTRGWHYSSSAVVSGSASWSYQSPGDRQSPKVQASMWLNSATWKATYAVRAWSVRVPTAWTYQLTLYWRWWSSRNSSTIYMVKWENEWDTQLYTRTFNSNTNETVNFNFDLGKFDVISFRFTFYYSWDSSAATLGSEYNLTLKQL